MKYTVIGITLCLVYSMTMAAITDNLVLYLPYDEGSGVITHDLSGNGYDGMLFTQSENQVDKWSQLINDDLWTTSKWVYAINFYNGQYHRNDDPGTIQKPIMDAHIIGEGIYVEPWADNPALGTQSAQDWSYSFWVKRPIDRPVVKTSSWVNTCLTTGLICIL